MTSLRRKILVIEDNAVNAKLLALYLEGEGFEVLHAEDGYTGIKMASTDKDISVILLDRIMPDIDGLDALKSLKRSSSRSSRIPVIMLTAALSPRQIEEAKLHGAFECLPKPYDKDKIINLVNQAIKGP